MTEAVAKAVDRTGKNIVIKVCIPFTNYSTEMNNTQFNNAKDIDLVIPMYNLYIETTVQIFQKVHVKREKFVYNLR